MVKDSAGAIVGRCVSGNIMITDDHKAQQGKSSPLEEPLTKRRSSEEGYRTTSGFSSRRGSMDSVDSQTMTGGIGRKRRRLWV